ncbi:MULTISPECIES: hypothetical protein [Streptomyces]|uniref:hypothetical protein n=1 Tax=Streptomyces TaxID=1883 RepID=UPI000A49B229|nr:hypothetical protein [Streptomyces sp. EAS-AB2608]MYU31006.1 hypothetical protein [Streptomyces sp. SID7810]BCM70401.1 hypothetical protein EASAB2608_05735 [Streptomyces sp. EAS-AB2608]
MSAERLARPAVVDLDHGFARPHTSWRVTRAQATEMQAPAPVRDPNWVADRSQGEHE